MIDTLADVDRHRLFSASTYTALLAELPRQEYSEIAGCTQGTCADGPKNVRTRIASDRHGVRSEYTFFPTKTLFTSVEMQR